MEPALKPAEIHQQLKEETLLNVWWGSVHRQREQNASSVPIHQRQSPEDSVLTEFELLRHLWRQTQTTLAALTWGNLRLMEVRAPSGSLASSESLTACTVVARGWWVKASTCKGRQHRG